MKADKMFEELGYERDYSIKHRHYVLFTKKIYDQLKTKEKGEIHIRLWTEGVVDTCFYITETDEEIRGRLLEFEEVLACAEWIKEQQEEIKNEKD